ncbi:equilibrative nucleoside transporter 4 isoform X1 [Physeter macrocephalus]|uniref:Equilibrative nucleoside transporter 4 n=1 Tax=Physeter macrocephalus TaxID=9755 RepID=A0A455AT41_PHYMC|nr:equilibrative nucleoside transporter 4 isoform X1 [Physeter catodon]|eukprot:XP_028339812.1 equilibrative nucleoside transporter 4 isoform X1 [Physeter catodon]
MGSVGSQQLQEPSVASTPHRSVVRSSSFSSGQLEEVVAGVAQAQGSRARGIPIFTDSEGPAPDDRYHAIYFAMLLAGVGFLLPYNSFITDVDYLHHKYPGTSIVFDMSLTYILVALVAVLLNNALVERLSLHTRITAGYLLALGPLLFISICDVWLQLFSHDQAYAANLAAVGTVAFGCTAIQLLRVHGDAAQEVHARGDDGGEVLCDVRSTCHTLSVGLECLAASARHAFRVCVCVQGQLIYARDVRRRPSASSSPQSPTPTGQLRLPFPSPRRHPTGPRSVKGTPLLTPETYPTPSSPSPCKSCGPALRGDPCAPAPVRAAHSPSCLAALQHRGRPTLSPAASTSEHLVQMSSVFLPGLDGPGSAVLWGRTQVDSGLKRPMLISPLWGYSVPSTYGTAGVMVSLSRILTKLLLPDERAGTLIFFLVSAGLELLCFLLHLLVRGSRFVLYHTARPRPGRRAGYRVHHDVAAEDVHFEHQGPGLANGGSPKDSPAHEVTGGGGAYTRFDVPRPRIRRSWPSFRALLLHRYVVARVIWADMLSIAVTYFITLCLFPGLESEIRHCILGEWLPILIMAVFNLSDFVGKILAALPVDWRGTHLLACSCLRVVFIPLFILCVYPSGTPALRHPAWPCVLSLLMGTSNGYFGSVPMILAAGKVSPKQRELAGNTMTVSYMTGLTLGSAVAYCTYSLARDAHGSCPDRSAANASFPTGL